MALFGSLATVRAQLASAQKFNPVFAYLDECFRQGSPAFRRVRQLAEGQQERTELDGGAFGLEQVYVSKQRANGFFESHKRYIDVQVIIEGSEVLEVVDAGKLQLQEDRTPEKDLLVYRMADPASVSPLRLDAGDCAVLFPVDAHMPGLAVGAPALVRKIVVKVPVE